jgi:hypothetical protein
MILLTVYLWSEPKRSHKAVSAKVIGMYSEKRINRVKEFCILLKIHIFRDT